MWSKVLSPEEPLEPETIRQILPRLSEKDYEFLFALSSLTHSSRFWEDYIVFEKTVRALNGLPVDFRNVEGVDVRHIWYAIHVASSIWPEREYSLDVQHYVKFESGQDGVYIYPPEMKDLYNPHYEEAIELANSDHILSDETIEEIQAIKYLTIQAYINTKLTKSNHGNPS